jgi:hypothetical protein
MMKKLLVLTAVVMLTVGTAGCRCDWFRRGALFPAVGPPVPVYESCPPADPCGECNACAPGGYVSEPMPGPAGTE